MQHVQDGFYVYGLWGICQYSLFKFCFEEKQTIISWGHNEKLERNKIDKNNKNSVIGDDTTRKSVRSLSSSSGILLLSLFIWFYVFALLTSRLFLKSIRGDKQS